MPVEIKYQFSGRVRQTRGKEIVKLLTRGMIVDLKRITHRLSRFGSSSEHRPLVTEFICELENGLMASLRLDKGGIQDGVEFVLSGQAQRHILAYELSDALGLHICPAAVRRGILRHGSGAISGRIACTPLGVYRYMQDRITDTGSLAYDPLSYTEAVIFDYIIGSGQRPESSYMIDEQKVVRSTHHYEAFSFLGEERLQQELSQTILTVSPGFMRQLTANYRSGFQFLLVRSKIIEEFGEEVWFLVEERLKEVVFTQKVAGSRFLVENDSFNRLIV